MEGRTSRPTSSSAQPLLRKPSNRDGGHRWPLSILATSSFFLGRSPEVLPNTSKLGAFVFFKGRISRELVHGAWGRSLRDPNRHRKRAMACGYSSSRQCVAEREDGFGNARRRRNYCSLND